MKRLEVLGGDQGDRDLVDAHLVLPDEVKQQIEGPFEVLEPNRDRQRRLELGVIRVSFGAHPCLAIRPAHSRSPLGLQW